MADKISWIDAFGIEHPLNIDNNFKVLSGITGRFMPPISFVEDEIPFQAGSRFRDIKIKTRDIDIPILIKAETEIELRQKIRDCYKMFNPMNGDGRIRITSADGSQRELFCRYSGGLEGKEDRSFKGLIWMNIILVFHAFDPYWYDTSTIVQTFTTGQPATFFPFFPLRLSSSTVFADITVENNGDVETYPEWIVTGDGDSIIFRNLTTGELTHLQTSLGAGETLIINTRSGKKSVKKSDGTNLYSTLTDDSSLWSLQQGTNEIRIEMSNATNQSSVQLSYQNRYLGA